MNDGPFRRLRTLLLGLVVTFGNASYGQRAAGQDVIEGNTASVDRIVDSLLQEGNGRVGDSPRQAAVLYHEALILSQTGKLKNREAKAHNNLAFYFAGTGKDSLAAIHLEKAIHINKHLDEVWVMQDQIIALSEIYLRLGKFHRVIALYDREKAFFDTNDVRQKLNYSYILNLAANGYFQLGQYAASLVYYQQILDAHPLYSKQNYKLLIDAYSGIGTIRSKLNLWEEALSNYQAAEKISRQFQDVRGIIYAMHHQGNAYLGMENYHKANEISLNALEMTRKDTNNNDARSACALIVAESLIGLDSFAEALPYCYEALEYATFFALKIESLGLLGRNLVLLKRWKEAQRVLLYAGAQSEKEGKSNNLPEIYQSLSQVYEATGRYGLSLTYFKKYARLNDSLTGKENTEALMRIENQYKVAEKDRMLANQNIAILKKENKIRKQNLWLSVSSGLGLTGILILYFRNKIKQNVLKQQNKIKYLDERLKGEQQERDRIAKELHDGVSVLVSAAKMTHASLGRKHRWVSHTLEYQEISALLNTTSQELRSISRNLIPAQLVNKSLPDAIDAFCRPIRKASGLEIEVQHSGNWDGLNRDDAYNLYRMVQELIQNILKHASAEKVLIQLLHHNGLIIITIEDDGVGFDTGEQKKGMGIDNLRDRISPNGGTINIRHHIPKGTIIEIEFPYSSHFNNE